MPQSRQTKRTENAIANPVSSMTHITIHYARETFHLLLIKRNQSLCATRNRRDVRTNQGLQRILSCVTVMAES